MNNKILELWEQSADRFPHGIKTNPERFAEAIIKECMSLFPYKSFKNEYDQDISGADIIKKHFGIEQ